MPLLPPVRVIPREARLGASRHHARARLARTLAPRRGAALRGVPTAWATGPALPDRQLAALN